MRKAYKKLVLGLVLLISTISLITGCSSKITTTSDNLDKPSAIEESQFEAWLKADAKEGFNSAIDRDFRRLTIISGALKKLHSTTRPEIDLGIAIGALESTIFTQESEYRRMDNNINISAEGKRAIVPAGLLNVLTRNRQILEHTYRDVILPYAEKLNKKQALTVEQEQAVTQTTDLIFRITQSYAKLSQERANMSFLQVDAVINELDKLQSQLNSIYFPLQ